MHVLAINNCLKEVGFDAFITKLFQGNGFKSTLFSFWPNFENPNAAAVFYGYDSCFAKYIGNWGLLPKFFPVQ